MASRRWALILAVTKNIAPEDANMKAGKNQWQSSVSAGLDGRTLGLIGLGKLGIKVTKVGLKFINEFIFLSI
jgi:phosphoglycerate dehydrogenase-like enzyme